MGQKIKPTALRTGIIKEWTSRWFPKQKRFGSSLQEDVLMRKFIKEKIGHAGIDSILIEKTHQSYNITIKTAKPGLIIGRGGKGIEDLTKELEKKLKQLKKKQKLEEPVHINISVEEIKRFEVSSGVIAQSIAQDLQKRMPYRRTLKKYIERIKQNREAQGAKIRLSGRLNGAEIARSEQLAYGSLPLQTLRANIDYAEDTAYTTYGTIGIKVWIYKGEVFEGDIFTSEK